MVQALDKTIEYVYNGIGNIVSVKTYDYTPKGTEPSGTPVTKSFTYSTSRPDRLTNYNGSIVTYSSMGCPTTFNGMSATWTRGKLSSITKGTIRTDRYNYAFQYNALGQRIEKSYTRVPPLNGISSLQAGDVTNYTKQYVYDHSGRLIQEATNGTKHEVGAYSETLKYLYDESGMIGFTYELNDEDDEAYYYQRNLLGDVIAIYNTSGNKVVEYAYDAYGNCTVTNSTNYALSLYNPIKYRGYYYDTETGWYYLNARYYSPEFRRFISPADTSTINPQTVNGLNLYVYAGNNPLIIQHSLSTSISKTSINSAIHKSSIISKKDSSSNNWNNLDPIPSWVSKTIDVADFGFSSSIVGLTAWYTFKYPGVADLMKLDGITNIPGKYSDWVEGLGYAFVFIETGLDLYSNWQQGQNAGYILASGAYTLSTGLAITWGSAKIGAYIGTSIGGAVGLAIGGAAGLIIGLGLELLSDIIKELIF